MTELLYAMCVWVVLPWVNLATDYEFYADGYHVETLSEGSPSSIGGYITNFCIPSFYTDIPLQYKASNAHGSSDLGPPLTVQWVWDFDYNKDSIVTFGDFGTFVGDYGSTAQRSDADRDGVVGFADFGKFGARFGECNNGKWVVPCG